MTCDATAELPMMSGESPMRPDAIECGPGEPSLGQTGWPRRAARAFEDLFEGGPIRTETLDTLCRYGSTCG
jgi:hypothetical protein